LAGVGRCQSVGTPFFASWVLANSICRQKSNASKKKQASEKLTEELLSQQSLPCTQLFSPVLLSTGFEVEVGSRRWLRDCLACSYLFSLVSDFASVHVFAFAYYSHTTGRLAHSLFRSLTHSVWIRLRRCHRILYINKCTHSRTDDNNNKMWVLLHWRGVVVGVCAQCLCVCNLSFTFFSSSSGVVSQTLKSTE
jgi:hypothetical protein